MASTDETIGANIRAYRQALDMSQADLAELLTEAGVPGFYPQTITKIESGKRSLKLAEGLEVARILRVEPRALYERPGSAVMDLRVQRTTRGLASSFATLVDAVRAHLDGMIEIGELLDTADGLSEGMLRAALDRYSFAALADAVHLADSEAGAVSDRGRELVSTLEGLAQRRDATRSGIGIEEDREIVLEPFPDDEPVREADIQAEREGERTRG